MSDEPRIYVASKTKHADRWRSLKAAGYPIAATWINQCHTGDSEFWWRKTWNRCLREAGEADVLVYYAQEGERIRGALAEVGSALFNAVPILYSGPRENIGNLARHPLVTVTEPPLGPNGLLHAAKSYYTGEGGIRQEAMAARRFRHAVHLKRGDRVRVDSDTYRGEGNVDVGRGDDHYLHLTDPSDPSKIYIGVRLTEGHGEVRWFPVEDVSRAELEGEG